MRLFIIAFLIYLGYVLLSRYLRSKEASKPMESGGSGDNGGSVAVDELVLDTSCGTYVPKSRARRLEHHNEILYFCSKECEQKFLSTLNRERA